MFSKMAKYIFKLHYQRKDVEGEYLEHSPEDVFLRIKRAYMLSDVTFSNTQLDDLFKLQMEQKFSFNSPTYYNLGIQEKPNLAACYVSDLDDHMLDIGDRLMKSMLIFKSGAGVGLPIWRLRPEFASLGDGGRNIVRTKSGASEGSSGCLSFMELFDKAGEVIKAAGKRRAAIMMVMMCWHPECLNFIKIKSGDKRDKFLNMNLSVGCTDKFMTAVADDKMWNLEWAGRTWETLPARELLGVIAGNAWATGDPGVLFMDTINKQNLVPTLGDIEATNPCGEQPLNPNTSCNLGAINLYKLYEKGQSTNSLLANVSSMTHKIMPFLDANIKIAGYPSKEFRENSMYACNTGLGIMGLASLLARHGIPYGSSRALELSSSIMEEITLSAWEWGVFRNVERAPCFEEKDNQDALKRVVTQYSAMSDHNKDRWDLLLTNFEKGMYPSNASVSTVAPTGSTGLAFDSITGGCEPIFALSYKRTIREQENTATFTIIDDSLHKALEEKDIELTKEMEETISKEGSIENTSLPDAIKEVFKTAHQIPWQARVSMQAALQEFCTSGVSGTVNLPESATVEDIGRVYETAYAKGCKGITVFRDKCWVQGVLNVGSKPKITKERTERLSVLKGRTFKGSLSNSEGSKKNVYVTANEDEDTSPIEVFIQVGNAGSVEAAYNQALGRLISDMLQSGMSVDRIIKRMVDIRSNEVGFCYLTNHDSKPVSAHSVPDLVAKFLRRAYVDTKEIVEDSGMKCPSCGRNTYKRTPDGCKECNNPDCGLRNCV